jgi:hypothetical protein
MIKRVFAPAMALFVCLALGSCTSFSNVVSDHWPTWAGGMPNDIPPRPGAPGYDDFLVHQQGKDAAAAAAPAANASAQAAPPGVPVEKASAQAAPSGNVAPNEHGAVQGGLY